MNKETNELLKEFVKERDWDRFHTPENLAKSISIEAGELLECFQWSSDFEKEHVQEELADVFIYCALLANKLHIDEDEIVRSKIKKNKMKYPVSKAKGNAKKYTDL